MPRILIVDDEEDILDLLEYNLMNSGFKVERAMLGRLALEAAGKQKPDLILLDEMLPDLRGFEVLRALRARPATQDVPVILLTARSGEADKLVGFELGADDYVVKPFSPGEVTARVRAVLKRVRGETSRKPALTFGPLVIDLAAHRVSRYGQELTLSPQEFRLLSFLATHPRRVYSREQLLAEAWDPDVFVDLRTVDVHVRRLRAQIEADPAAPRFLQTVRGSGYLFDPAGSEGG